MKNLKIILVDDNDAFRKALKTLLVKQYNLEILGEADSANDYWKLNNRNSADIIIMDVMLPGIDGISLTKKILFMHTYVKVLAITMHSDKVYLKSLIEAGFWGCVFKNNIFNQIYPAIESLSNGERYFPENIQQNNDN